MVSQKLDAEDCVRSNDHGIFVLDKLDDERDQLKLTNQLNHILMVTYLCSKP